MDLINTIRTTIFVPGWVSTVFWNGVVGYLVFYFTVRVVDNKAKKREQELWQPAKDNIYYNLFWSLTTIADSLRLSQKWKVDKYYYYHFGDYFVAIRYDVNDLKYQEVKSASLDDLSPYTVSSLENASKEIDALMHNHPQLFEPDLLGQLLPFKERLESDITILNRYLTIGSDFKKGSVDLQPMTQYVFALLAWLSKRATMTPGPEQEHSNSANR
jgi:hypothetical protein